MKLIAALYLTLFVMIVACGPHFNTNAKQEPYQAEADNTPPQYLQVRLPNWPAYSYGADGVIMVIVVRDPQKLQIPKSITLKTSDGPLELQPIKGKEADK
jgi:hypothetical protein